MLKKKKVWVMQNEYIRWKILEKGILGAKP